MTAVLSSSPSPTSSSHQAQSPTGNASLSALPPLVTNHPTRRSNLQRPPSYARNRMSTYSTTSNPSQNRSRPPSHAFPTFHSSLPYALVRDFAYPIINPYHYGPPAESSANQSGNSTPASEFHRRLSDSAASWDGANPQWSAGPWGGDGFFPQPLPQMAYGDGPPYSEDEDLHSPVVVSSRHKKSKSTFATLGGGGRGRGRSPGYGNDGEQGATSVPANHDKDRGYFTGTNGDGSETYYTSEGSGIANGPGGEIAAYPPDQTRQSLLAPITYTAPGQRDSHFATTLPSRSYMQEEPPDDSDEDASEVPNQSGDSRYSKDYQFTIASPDEEMHGKAVALFDFARENENELPLIEGQVIWVSYRHGQGWLVAEDPKTRESGLVPEEYVRLLRDIEGGWTSLSGELNPEPSDEKNALSPDSAATPTQPDPSSSGLRTTYPAHPSNGSTHSPAAATTEKHPPIVSTFSTSSKDLSPYPHRLLGTQPGQTPPQVVHYGSQSSTPTLANSPGDFRRGFGGESRGLSVQKEVDGEDDEEDEEDGDTSSEEMKEELKEHKEGIDVR